jgi:intracellular septation protein
LFGAYRCAAHTLLDFKLKSRIICTFISFGTRMQFLYDFFPIIIFFTVYKFAGIYYATAAAMLISLVQVSVYWYKHRSFDKLQLVTLILILLLGGATLILHKPIFIKWKPSVVYWVFALIFFGSNYIGKKPLMQHMMDKKIQLPTYVWKRINLSWGIFFALIGFLNLYVIYHFSTDTWVNFKLFGVLGLTVVFSIGQAIYLSRHVK